MNRLFRLGDKRTVAGNGIRFNRRSKLCMSMRERIEGDYVKGEAGKFSY